MVGAGAVRKSICCESYWLVSGFDSVDSESESDAGILAGLLLLSFVALAAAAAASTWTGADISVKIFNNRAARVAMVIAGAGERRNGVLLYLSSRLAWVLKLMVRWRRRGRRPKASLDSIPIFGLPRSMITKRPFCIFCRMSH